MPTETLAPDAIISSTNLTGAVTDIDESIWGSLNLLREYRFDEGSGTQLTDYASGHHGTIPSDTTAPTWTADGLSFDDSNDLVTLPMTGYPTGDAGASIFVAMNLTSGTGGGAFSFGANSLRRVMFVGRATTSALRFGVWSDDLDITITGGYTQSLVAVHRYDPSVTTIYGDVPTTSDSNSRVLGGAMNLGTTGSYVGRFSGDTIGGSIFYVMVFTRFLTNDEMTIVYNYIKTKMSARDITV